MNKADCGKWNLMEVVQTLALARERFCFRLMVTFFLSLSSWISRIPITLQNMRPSVLDNVNHWQVFDTNAQIKYFLECTRSFAQSYFEGSEDGCKEFCPDPSIDSDKNFIQLKGNKILKGLVSLERFFTRNDMFIGKKTPDEGSKIVAGLEMMSMDFRDRIIAAYLDDLIVFSKERKNHLKYLKAVLQRCREHSISLNPKKSVFCVTEGKLLGHIVSKEGVKIDPDRVNAIQNLSLPSNWIGVRSFFNQVDESGIEAPIAFMSVPLKKHELKYSLSEKQAFFVVKAVKQFRYYILHSHSMVFVLDSAVKSILTQQEVRLNKRATWVTKIQEYDLDICPTKTVKGQGLCKLIAENKIEIDEALPLTLFVGLQDTWFFDVAYYLTYGSFSGHLSTKEQRHLKLKEAKYVIWQDVLYKKGLDGTYLRCVDKPQQRKLLEECEKCQLFSGKPHLAALPLRLVVVDEPFKEWGIDFIGLINPHSNASHMYILTAIDYFTKWVEVVPTKKANSEVVCDFLKDCILVCFGVPQKIVTDNASYFSSEELTMFSYEHQITLSHSSNYFPQGNGLVESSNKNLIAIMKKLVDDNAQNWHKKVYEALWADRITPKREIGMSPYELVYGIGAKVSLPLELAAARLQTVIEDSFFQNALEKIVMYLMRLEEEREMLVDRITEHQNRVKRIFDMRAQPRGFLKGDEVLLWEKRREPKGAHGKFYSLWKGPFKIHEVVGLNGFRINYSDETVMPYTYNGQDLKLCQL
ncbi:uncharacterized protein LOC131858300 [Cryptomeria japonica]|uniref:uncharacterized protein LOC131858300 n=1 Tax=Cryptomeria japonica TaxID=3369 RepID=UPI0027DA21FD|nr:uncharacterized protein LOC131858300 [Cryptomeria japonica]